MWCPKCKNEYREGITVCADCGCELVEDLNMTAGESDFNYSEEEYTEAPDDDNMDEDNSRAAEVAQQKPGFAYVPRRTRYEDNKSSAVCFLLIGGIGAVLVLLHCLHIIDFNLSLISRIMTNTVMGAMFIIFLIIGVVSAKNSSRYKKEAEQEEALTDNIVALIGGKYTSERIDEVCGVTDTAEAYERWSLRYDFIKSEIISVHPDIAEDYVEYVTEIIYNDLFGKNE